METSTRLRFESSTAPDGTAWKPSKRALKTGGRTLVKSGRLQTSITHNVLGRDAVEIGTNVIYAAVHQFGAKIALNPFSVVRKADRRGRFNNRGRQRKRVTYGARTINIPARPFLGLSDADEAEVVRIATEALSAALRGGATGGEAP